MLRAASLRAGIHFTTVAAPGSLPGATGSHWTPCYSLIPYEQANGSTEKAQGVRACVVLLNTKLCHLQLIGDKGQVEGSSCHKQEPGLLLTSALPWATMTHFPVTFLKSPK